MFCPKCAAENELDQGYCRQCGQRLAGVRLALEGSSDQSLAELKAGGRWITGGTASLAAFAAIALAIGVLGVLVHDLSFGYIAFLNLILGCFIGLPLLGFGRAKLKHATRLLTTARIDTPGPAELTKHDALSTAGLNGPVTRLPLPGSVTEHTTLELERPGSTRGSVK